MYTVRIIPPDLRHEETIIQAALALDCLNKTINSVFERIDSRISKNNARLQTLDSRIDRAQQKIRGLVGIKKAIKIYAPARFPASQVFRDIPLTFDSTYMDPSMEAQPSKSGLPSQPMYEVQSRVEAPTTQDMKEKLVFFHVRSPHADVLSTVSHNCLNLDRAQATQRHGLGNLPPQTRSVNSLLVFDTKERAYDGIDGGAGSWKRAKLFKQQRQPHSAPLSLAQKLLEPAPHSLATNRAGQKTVTPSGGLRYMPKLNDAPEIDLPMDLPDLPGIADDIHFEGQGRQQIAPSLFVDELPDLRTILDQTDAIVENVVTVPQPAVRTSVPTATLESKTAQLESATTMAPTTEQQFVQPVLSSVPPPPPPPPPIPTLATQSSSALSDLSNSRSELMDAIRKAGGARGGQLRAAAAAPIDEIENKHGKSAGGAAAGKSVKSKPSGGDLMADLHNKLLMRRKGISGFKNDKQTNVNANANANTTTDIGSSRSSGNPVMSRLSALIPPPPSRSKGSDDDNNDTDFDDNDADWTE